MKRSTTAPSTGGIGREEKHPGMRPKRWALNLCWQRKHRNYSSVPLFGGAIAAIGRVPLAGALARQCLSHDVEKHWRLKAAASGTRQLGRGDRRYWA